MINSATGFLADCGGDRPARHSRQETARFPRASPANRAGPRLLPSHTFCVGMLDLASVSTSVRSISNSVRRTPPPVSANLRRKPPLIARRAGHHCAPLHLLRLTKVALNSAAQSYFDLIAAECRFLPKCYNKGHET